METNSKKKTVLNLFNILTVILILAAMAAVLYFFIFKEEEDRSVNTLKIEYTLEIKHVPDELTDKIAIGDSVRESLGQVMIGTVSGVEYTPSFNYVMDESTGEIVSSEYPDHSDIIVTVRAQGIKTGTGYDINGCMVNVGRVVRARFPDFASDGYCIMIRTVTE